MFKVTINDAACLTVTCPKCGHQQAELVSRLRSDPKLTCGGCGITIDANGAQLDDFLKSLKSLGS